jgi:hypothetical protein
MPAPRRVSSTAQIPRVHDEFGDGDTRLDALALMVGPLAPRDIHTESGTVIMPAAVSPAPIVLAVTPYGPYGAEALTLPRARQARHHASAPAFSRVTAIEVIVASLGVATLVTVGAVLWAHFF